MKIVKKIILIIVIIILLIVLYAKYVKQEQIIKIFGNACLIVVTGSMEDTILPGELIIISERENYKIGDIVTSATLVGYKDYYSLIQEAYKKTK